MTNSYAEIFSDWAASLEDGDVSEDARAMLHNVVTDCGGLAVAARHTDYVATALASSDADGPATAIGHARGFTPGDAAIVGGTSIHGEDFDDSFEGTPVHVGAVVVPAVLAVAEAFGRSGADALKGIAVGGELMCRMAVVAPTAIHRAGFHPTAVIGTMGAAAGVSATLGLRGEEMTSAFGVAGSMASGIIEYLAEGTWTKRLHPGWAAHAGIRAALLARAGFKGPRTVFEGRHGFYNGFADPSIAPDFSELVDGLGEDWRVARLALKPFACGTMLQPFIDCAIRLRSEIGDLSRIDEITAKVGEGTVHRLWDPREEKCAPSTPYSAKFSGPYCIAVALVDGAAGLEQFSEARFRDPAIALLAGKVQHEIDPSNEYPRNYSGELIVRLADGSTLREVQPFLRGGIRAPLSDDELARKFMQNTEFGGWPEALASTYISFADDLFSISDFSVLKEFRQ